MLTGLDLFKKFGHPDIAIKSLVVWDVPIELEKGIIPHKIYCHKDMVIPLTNGFKNLIQSGVVEELKTWDGCWNYRVIRGYEQKYIELVKNKKIEESIKLLSIHSWAYAFDVNQKENQLGTKPKLSEKFVKCFTDAEFEWGGKWKRLDGMHFQLNKIMS